jgi:hypothetical protein
MSYDFRLFAPKTGEDPLITVKTDSGLPTTPPDLQNEARKRRIADSLIAHNPQLHLFQIDYHAVAKSQKISVEMARLKFRHLELNGPDNGNGIQITLFDDEASLTVPFWHKGDKARDTFREIWSYFEIISREAGYLIYDPQIDRVLDPSEGFEDSLSCYTGAVRTIHEVLPPGGAARKSWWKFW